MSSKGIKRLPLYKVVTLPIFAMEKQAFSPLEQALIGINFGISENYYWPILTSKGFPSKEVLNEAKADIQHLLQQYPPVKDAGDLKNSRAIIKYGEIADLLLSIPEEHLIEEKEYSDSLYHLAQQFGISFSFIKRGDFGVILSQKYKLMATSSKFGAQQMTGVGNPSAGKLVELTKKYVELLNIYRSVNSQNDTITSR